MSGKLVLVTGASSFVGSHLIVQLLEAGYAVRGTARGSKVALVQSVFSKYPKFEAVEVSDISTGDFSTALKGVSAVAHVASPLAGSVPPDVLIKTAVDGTLNVLRQAVAAGVTKVVVTCSWATAVDPDLKNAWVGGTITEDNWGRATTQDVLTGGNGPMWDYLASKIIAEKEAWKFAEEHPELDLATINPPFIYGPTIPGLEISSPDGLGTNGHIYRLISGEPGRALPMQLPPNQVDVRDVARAHKLALELPPRPKGTPAQSRRFLVSNQAVTWKEVVEYLQTARPDVKDRLPDPATAQPFPGELSVTVTARARDVLGLKEYIPWQKTVSETVDTLLAAEKTWKA